MESDMDLEDLSELSELEEGEIHDDVEIISEYIRNPQNKPSGPPRRRQNNPCSKKVIPPKPVRAPSSNDKNACRGNKGNRTIQRVSTQHRLKISPPCAGQSSKKNFSVSHPSKSRSRSTSNSLTPPYDKSRVKPQPKQVTSSGIKSREPKPRSPADSKVSDNKPKKLAVTSSLMPAAQPYLSPKENGGDVSETKWRNTFETVSSVDKDSNMSISSEEEEDDEVMMLRLAALHSLDSNVRPKVPADAQIPSAVSTPTSEPTLNPPVHEHEDEDEDEELLRAQLLIEVARKQTMESETQQQSSDVKATDLGSVVRSESKAEVETRPSAPPLKNSLLTIPKADRLVIDLRDDSDSSSDEEGNAVENSITALLKSARLTVEKKADSAQTIPQALSHLPRHQQEEYQRLKQEILRREQSRLLQAQQAGSKPATPTGPPEESNNDATSANAAAEAPAPTISTNTAPRVIVANIPQQPPAAKTALPQLSAALHPDVVAKENAKSTTPTRTTPVSRLAVLKQQLARKRRDLAVTKGALQKQLELVDRNRTLWMKSSQEVSRLKSMLQQAEDTEKQLREQLTSSQQQTQRLKTRMQSVERNIVLLHNGLGINRKRTSSLKIRHMSPKLSPRVASAGPFPFLSPSSATFKVKPRIIAKALAKNHFPYSNMTYTKSSTVSKITSSSSNSSVAAAQNLVLLTPKQKQAASRIKHKKALTDEQWLFGTLGDDWDDTKTDTRPSMFPQRLVNGHASRSTSEMRLDFCRVVCRYDLDSTCQDINCSFQHLPPASSSQPFGMAVNGVSSFSATSARLDTVFRPFCSSSQDFLPRLAAGELHFVPARSHVPSP